MKSRFSQIKALICKNLREHYTNFSLRNLKPKLWTFLLSLVATLLQKIETYLLSPVTKPENILIDEKIQRLIDEIGEKDG